MRKYYHLVILPIVILIAYAVDSTAQTGVITTIAGNGVSAYTGEGVPATTAEILNPLGSGAFDSYGNYYFAERYAHRIRKISSGGIISTVAGNGIAGFSGDAIAATATELNNPNGVAVDKSGNLYIVEIEGCRIRKVDAATGIINTIAGNGTPLENGDGGLATVASIYFPNSLCLDQNGNLYVTDDDNKIRKIDIVTGIITSVAGKGGATGFSGDGGIADSAQLDGPSGICTDTLNNLFIADYYNDRIRKVDATTNIITTIAGGALGTYNGEGLIATAAQLNPFQLLFDIYGNLYVADEHNYRVRRIDTTGHIYTVAGNGTSGFSGDNGPATDAEIFFPDGIAFDACGNLYIADNGNARIRKVDLSSCDPLLVSNTLITPAINIYPNPATTTLSITATNKITQIVICNLIGQTVYNQAYDIEKAEVNISGLSDGIYIVKVTDSEGQKAINKIVKQ